MSNGRITDPDVAIERAKADDLVINFIGRIGAHPYMRFTPYENNRGVRVHMWSCISYSFKAMPDRTLLSFPRIIEPDESDDYRIRMFTDEWVWKMVNRSRGVELVPLEESPFKSELMRWEDE